jgi:hypothetical protein
VSVLENLPEGVTFSSSVNTSGLSIVELQQDNVSDVEDIEEHRNQKQEVVRIG